MAAWQLQLLRKTINMTFTFYYKALPGKNKSFVGMALQQSTMHIAMQKQVTSRQQVEILVASTQYLYVVALVTGRCKFEL